MFMKLKRILKKSSPIPLDFSMFLWFWYHKNSYIFLIIILKSHALIPYRLEENIKNVPILVITVVGP